MIAEIFLSTKLPHLVAFSYIQDISDKTATSEIEFERSAGEWECGLDVFFRSRQFIYGVF